MSPRQEVSAERQRVAAEALAALGPRPEDYERLNVQCRHSHHVARVYETGAGFVYRALTGPHAHGSKDRADVPHHAAERGMHHVDLLPTDPADDRFLPAWCDCGSWSLSGADLLEHLRVGAGTMHLP